MSFKSILAGHHVVRGHLEKSVNQSQHLVLMGKTLNWQCRFKERWNETGTLYLFTLPPVCVQYNLTQLHQCQI